MDYNQYNEGNNQFKYIEKLVTNQQHLYYKLECNQLYVLLLLLLFISLLLLCNIG